jgi:ApaG protein
MIGAVSGRLIRIDGATRRHQRACSLADCRYSALHDLPSPRTWLPKQAPFSMSDSRELPGLRVVLDKLVHHTGPNLPPDRPHAFVYFLTIHNGSDRTVTLLGRKWVVQHADGTQLVVEGDKIVGQTPRLAPGEHFSYNSYHVTATDARVHGSFHGVDESARRIHVGIPTFDLRIPDE